jgi:predicted dehydrogenase
MISRHHLIAWGRVDAAEVVAICDPDLQRARQRGRDFHIEDLYSSVDAMLESTSLDVVDVASPRETHGAVVRAAAREGINVICQKPLCPTLDEARALVDEVADRVRLMVHENWRYRPYFQQVARWIAEQRFGGIQQCRISVRSSGLVAGRDGRYPALERQPFMATESRLAIAEQMIHHLDVARFLHGPLRVVAAKVKHAVGAVVGETLAVVLLETGNGTPIIVESNMAAPGYPARADDELELIGTRACAKLERLSLSLTGEVEETLNYSFDDAYQASFDHAIAHFVEAVQTGTEFETNARDNLETLKLVEDAYALSSS